MIHYTQLKSQLAAGLQPGQENHAGAECPGPAAIFDPLCAQWMSLVCVLMSSSEKDVPQLHCVFHLLIRTETWTAHPDAFEQNILDARPCSRILMQLFRSLAKWLEILHGASWQSGKKSQYKAALIQLLLHHPPSPPESELNIYCTENQLLEAQISLDLKLAVLDK